MIVCKSFATDGLVGLWDRRLYARWSANNTTFTHLLLQYHKMNPYHVDSKPVGASIAERLVVYKAWYVAWSNRSLFIQHGLPLSTALYLMIRHVVCFTVALLFVHLVREPWLCLSKRSVIVAYHSWLSSLFLEGRLAFLLLLSVLIRFVVLLTLFFLSGLCSSPIRRLYRLALYDVWRSFAVSV